MSREGLHPNLSATCQLPACHQCMGGIARTVAMLLYVQRSLSMSGDDITSKHREGSLMCTKLTCITLKGQIPPCSSALAACHLGLACNRCHANNRVHRGAGGLKPLVVGCVCTPKLVKLLGGLQLCTCAEPYGVDEHLASSTGVAQQEARPGRSSGQP